MVNNMDITTLAKIFYVPSDKARVKIRKQKEKYPKKSLNSILEEMVINSK